MKSLITFILLSSSIFATDLTCKRESRYANGMFVHIEVTATNLVSNEGRYTFEELTLLNVLHDEDIVNLDSEDIYYKDIVSYQSISNNEIYRPRVYKGHAKFNLSYDYSRGDLEGRYSFLVPTEILEDQKIGESFKSYLIMSDVGGHYGATIDLECVLK